MPNKEWSAPGLAPKYQRDFRLEASRANLAKAKKRTRGPLRVPRIEFV